MLKFTSAMSLAVTALLGVLSIPSASAASSPAKEAMQERKETEKVRDIVQNRFFLKANRFEVSPWAGYVPNNPFAERYVGGATVAYHMSESFAAEGQIFYSPDLNENDLKGLTGTLVQIAHSGDPSVEFQQPVEKMIQGFSAAARWAPVYGKINLLGERVLNFDFYGQGGLGLLSIAEYYARYDDAFDQGQATDPVSLEWQEDKVKITANLGVGFDFFLNQTIALKLDARSFIYPDDKPVYEMNATPEGKRVYNNFLASAGISIFIPKMKPRFQDF